MENKSVKQLFLISFALVFALGCVQEDNFQNLEQQQLIDEENSQEDGADKSTEETARPELTTKITPAKDVTGRWSGNAFFKDNVANPQCSYEGVFNLDLQQNGNNLVGTYQMTIKKSTQLLDTGLPCVQPGQFPMAQITGSVSTSRIEFTDNFADFTGSFTSDLMSLDFESCPNQECADGSAGVGTKGNAKLTRQQ